MKAAIALILVASPALACDWQVSEKVDPMTDAKVCMIHSASAHLGVGVRGNAVSFTSPSRYGRRDFLTLRVDDLGAIQMLPKNRSTEAHGDDARRVLAQIRSGQRLRVQFRDIGGTVDGEAAICNLPALIDACAK